MHRAFFSGPRLGRYDPPGVLCADTSWLRADIPMPTTDADDIELEYSPHSGRGSRARGQLAD